MIINFELLNFVSFSANKVSFINYKDSDNELKIGVQDTNVVIDWKYNLSNPNILKEISFGYKKNNGDGQVNIANKKKGQLLIYNKNRDKQDENNIIVEADDTSIAKVILKEIILDYENKRIYFCQIQTDSEKITSRVTINVYGK